MGNQQDQENKPSKRERCCHWLGLVRVRLYAAHAITSWGDRMWSFAVALFLVKMSLDFDLRLTAIFGLVCSCTAIIFGASVGKWIDHTPRFQAVTRALVIQNASVIISAAVICIILNYLTNLQNSENVWIFRVSQVSVIFLGATAYLAGMVSNICISKDWIVVVAKGDKDQLASINAMCRRIDLTTKICSPLVVGCLMAQMSDLVVSLFIASWNVVSMIAEYYLLRSVYRNTPELASKNQNNLDSDTSHPLVSNNSSNVANQDIPTNFTDATKTLNILKSRMKMRVTEIGHAWATYFRHPIFPAGLGLACLYMTVLAFDGITIGYAYSQGVTEAILGILGGAGALVGIISTLIYPSLRKRIGSERTGLIGFFSEVTCLILCVISVWAPGSPFDPHSIASQWSATRNGTSNANWTEHTNFYNNHTNNSLITSNMSTNNEEPRQWNYASIILLMTGIVAARFGLWLIDLSVTQILQERVEENNRGAINGVQHALNMFMDLLKYGLVILFPSPETFGLLTLISFTVICSGWISYAIYSWKIRRHILPFHQYFRNCTGHIPPLQTKDSKGLELEET